MSNKQVFLLEKTKWDSIIIFHENIHSLEVSNKQGFLMKLDLSKSYDRFDWGFLCKVLKVLCFSHKFIKFFSTLSTIVLVNDMSSNFFQASCSIKNGDTISPIFFCIMVEPLGRHIGRFVQDGKIQGLQHFSNFSPYSHKHFFDDTIVMGIDFVKEAKKY